MPWKTDLQNQRTHRVLPGATLLGLLLGLAAAGLGDENEGAVPFDRGTLLEKFDGDGDGLFSSSERLAVVKHYGVEVPMLPRETPDFGICETPPHWSDVVQHCDSTPPENPPENRRASLGRVLFYDRQLSKNNTIACASCHHQRHGFADPARFSRGFAGGQTGRNSMGLANLRFTRLRIESTGFFWDERADSLETQALAPIQDAVEMGMDLDALESKLQALPYYPALFDWAFGAPEVRRERIAQSLAQFVRSLTSTDSRFDRAAAQAGGWDDDFPEFTRLENLGRQLFLEGPERVPEFSCGICHSPPTFNAPAAFNIGLAKEYRDPGLGKWNGESNDPFTPSNDGKFRPPSLKNVALTSPYMHDGRFTTLEQVVDHYSSGLQDHPNLGVAVRQTDANGRSGFHLTDVEKRALVAFLHTLTDETLVGDERFSDPFVRLDD